MCFDYSNNTWIFTFNQNFVNFYLFKKDTIFKLNDTDGPIKTAKMRVPIPKVPPKIQPSTTTENSMLNLTKLIGFLYLFDIPVIKPSLVPGPRFAIR